MACYARIRLMSLSICVLLAGCTPDWTVATGSTAAGRIAGPTEPGGAEEWLLPSTVNGYLMRTQLYRPPGGGPFPMALISHGSQQDAMRRKKSPRSDFAALARWFVSRGYVVVLPERPGHGGGGRYLEDQRGCDDADYIGAANGAADSISIAVDYMKRQSFVLPQGSCWPAIRPEPSAAWLTLRVIPEACAP